VESADATVASISSMLFFQLANKKTKNTAWNKNEKNAQYRAQNINFMLDAGRG
jgi:hypothetical protein